MVIFSKVPIWSIKVPCQVIVIIRCVCVSLCVSLWTGFIFFNLPSRVWMKIVLLMKPFPRKKSQGLEEPRSQGSRSQLWPLRRIFTLQDWHVSTVLCPPPAALVNYSLPWLEEVPQRQEEINFPWRLPGSTQGTWLLRKELDICQQETTACRAMW